MPKKLLEKAGADFQEINMDERPDMIDYVKSLGFTAAPVIKAGEIAFSGFQPNKLKKISAMFLTFALIMKSTVQLMDKSL